MGGASERRVSSLAGAVAELSVSGDGSDEKWASCPEATTREDFNIARRLVL